MKWTRLFWSCTIPVRVISRVFPKWDRLLSIRLSAGLQLGDYRLTPRLAPVDEYTAPAEHHSPRSRQVPTTHEVVATGHSVPQDLSQTPYAVGQACRHGRRPRLPPLDRAGLGDRIQLW